jgi:hypothetical protein
MLRRRRLAEEAQGRLLDKRSYLQKETAVINKTTKTIFFQ